MKCLIVDDEELTRKIVGTLVSKTPFLQLVKSCSNAIEATEILMKEKIELLFLDIEMPEMDGWELIKIIPEPKPQIILITSNRGYAKEAFDFNVTDFILKPVTQERFLKAVYKAKKNADNNNNNSTRSVPDHDIYLRVESLLIKVNTKNIVYIEALSDYVIVHTASDKYTVHSTMKGIGTNLPQGLFMRVHNSFIVRLDKISNIDQNLIVINEKLIPISRANKAELMRRLNVV